MTRFCFDNDKFEQTAKVVLKYNQFVEGYTVDTLVAFMQSFARQYPNSVSGTMGFYIASVPSSINPDDLYVAAFPAPWIIPV